MNKQEVIEQLAGKDHSKKEVEDIIDGYWELIAKTLKKGDDVSNTWGKFELRKRPAREGRNPATGETIKIAAKVVPVFKPGKKFKDAVKK
jgi:DNA-binding protein HU-beta